jgi:hypothetical protein
MLGSSIGGMVFLLESVANIIFKQQNVLNAPGD